MCQYRTNLKFFSFQRTVLVFFQLCKLRVQFLVSLFLFVFSISVFEIFFLLLNNSLSSQVILNVKKKQDYFISCNYEAKLPEQAQVNFLLLIPVKVFLLLKL